MINYLYFGADNNGYLLFGAVIVVAFVIAGLRSFFEKRSQRKRRNAFQQLANQHGLTFKEKVDPDFLPGCGLTRQGDKRRADNLLQGEMEGVSYYCFDFHHRHALDQDDEDRSQTVVIFECEDSYIPTFALTPKNIADRLATVFGYQDINFGTHKTFSDRYLLRGENELAIRDFFHSARLNFLEENLGHTLEGNEGHFFVYNRLKMVEPEQLQQFLGQAYKMYKGVAAPS